MSRHHRTVHELRTAAESGDIARMLPLLDPAVAVVVDPGRTAEREPRVVRGRLDAADLLLHGMLARPGLAIDERPVNGQSGLVLRRDDVPTAAITVDFTRGLISVIWVTLLSDASIGATAA
jgi:RNA polymerase sigma-70 factor (ECF subfamily)